MSISINLLPDVRLARIRAQRRRHLVMGVSIIIWVVVGAVTAGTLLLRGAQMLVLTNLNHDIANNTSTLKAIPHLNQALTAQMAANNLGALYSQRTYYSKFMTLVASRIPLDVSLTELRSTSDGTINVTGTARSIYSINKLVEALLTAPTSAVTTTPATMPDGTAAMPSTSGATAMSTNSTMPYFSNIVMNSVSKDESGKATFSFTATTNPEDLNGTN